MSATTRLTPNLDDYERVFTLIGRVPELCVAAPGTLKSGGVLHPLFSAFGPAPIRARMSIGRARVLATTEALYRRSEADYPRLATLDGCIEYLSARRRS